MAKSFTRKAASVLNGALEAACALGHTYIGSEHLLLALASESDCVAAKLLDARGITPERIRQSIIARVGCGERTRLTPGNMTPRVKRIIENSAAQSSRTGLGYIGTEHLLLALLAESDSVAVTLLEENGADPDELSEDTDRFLGAMADPGLASGSGRQPVKLKDAPSLAQYGRDLTAMARDGRLDPMIGREAETERVMQILSRRTKNNPCLIGEPGVGKTAVVEGLASRIASGNVPETLAGRSLITLDIPSMIAGAKYRGEFEERMKSVMAEAAGNPSVILFIDELHTLIGAGAAEGAVDAANILKPALARGEIQMIGATTIDEYRAHIEKDSALERRFQPVMVGEPSPDEAAAILRGLRDRYESHHRVKITDEAIDAAVKLSVRYLGDRFLPDKAIDLIDEAASRKRISARTLPVELVGAGDRLRSLAADKEEAVRSQDFERAAKLRDEEKRLRLELENRRSVWNDRSADSLSIGAEDIAEIVTAWSGVPVKRLEQDESERLLGLEELLKARVIGQDEAVEAVARAVRRGRTGLRDPKRPAGSFLFIGPTGVGKTELAKALAEAVFGSESALIRIDMSEYMEKHSVSKLIGSPPGYIGYREGGQLTGKVRRKPYSVVLFDEIEKAHPDVFDLFLQLLEDGVLTDSEGRKADFTNTIIIMTSNVGASLDEPKRLGFTPAPEDGGYLDKALRRTFRPEFLNRIDEVITFRRLSEESVRKIASVMLERSAERMRALGYEVTFEPELVGALAREGSDPVWGARPLRRLITRKLEDSFASAMLNGEFKPGDRLTAIFENGEIAWKKSNLQ